METVPRSLAFAKRPLDGVRILDFSWVRAGPWATRWLGALGADVIKVEWPENERGRAGDIATPQHLEVGLNTNGHFSDTNANKRSLTVNVRSAKGMDIIRRLLAMSDIVIENFSSRVLSKWGLGYEQMCAIKPDIVYVSMSGYGHTGRNHQYTTFGPVAQAVSGLTHLSGLPGEQPAGWGWSYMNDTGGMYGAMCALTGLYHRNMTGKGQHIDQSQMISGVPLVGPALLDFSVNGRASKRPGFPPGNRAHWPGTPALDNYRGPMVAPHNAYRTAPSEFNDWCVIVCSDDDEWRRLVAVMGAPAFACQAKFDTVAGRLEHQDELDIGIEQWSRSLDKYALTQVCQAANVCALPVQSAADRVERDPQLRQREHYVAAPHAALGEYVLQNAPFEMSQTPAINHSAGPRIGEHTSEILRELLGFSDADIHAGYADGTLWPAKRVREVYMHEASARSAAGQVSDMIASREPITTDNATTKKTRSESAQSVNSAGEPGPLAGLRVVELGGAVVQFCGKLMADLGAEVIKVEPPHGDAARAIGPFYRDQPHHDRSLYFWYYNTSKRGITLDLDSPAGHDALREVIASADVLLECCAPGYMQSIGLDYETLAASQPRLIMCALTPFGQTGPWRDYRSSDLAHLAAGGQMASCGYDKSDVPGDMPIAPGGGNAWHMGGHYAYMAILAALVYRSVSGLGQYIDASIHEACALTTEAAVPAHIYRGDELLRQTGRHHASAPTSRTQFLAKDGKYVTALIANQLGPAYVKRLARLLDECEWPHDLHDPRYAQTDFVSAQSAHIIETVVGKFIATRGAEDVYHLGQAHGFTWGAVRAAEDLFDDPHLHDREFWKSVAHPELGETFTYPGEPAIYNGSPWRISARAPLLGEHNAQILCDELGLSVELSARASGLG